MKKYLLSASAAAILTCASAQALAQVNYDDFHGFYAGGDVGFVIGDYGVGNPAGPDGEVGMNGLEGGLFAGYGFVQQFDWIANGYLGAEFAYEWSDSDGAIGGTRIEKDDGFMITVRPGLTMNEDALFYGIAGYSRAEFDSVSGSGDLDGLVIGGGTEFAASGPLKLRVEYTYTNFEDENLGAISFDGHEGAVKTGLVFRF